MFKMYFSPAVSLFTGTRKSGAWFVGQVTALQGPRALRVVHECLQLRDTPAEAHLDACADAEKLQKMWKDNVRL